MESTATTTTTTDNLPQGGGGAGATNSGPTTTEQIVEFLDDANVITDDYSHALPSAGRVANDGHDLNSNQITDVLSRPILLGDFTWEASSGALGNLGIFSLPGDWLRVRMISDKLRGFRFARFDLVLSVQVNAQPFNAGALMLWYEPLAGQQGTVPSSTSSLSGMTGFPNVIWRCGDSTTFELRIPYAGPLSHFDLVRGRGTMGGVKLEILSPLTGAADVDGTVWIRAENVEFEMPTGQDTYVFPPVNAQAGGRKREEEAGFVTRLTGAAAKVANTLAEVPIISPIATTVGSALSSISDFASIFGWSKPVSAQMAEPVVPVYNKYMTTYNGQTNGKVMALDAENKQVIPTDQIRHNIDEMALTTVLSKETMMDRFTWKKTDGSGDQLFTAPVSPMYCLKRYMAIDLLDGALCDNTTLSYVSTFFRFWRGTLKYKIMLVKTGYHSGRLEVIWSPSTGVQTLSSLDLNQCYRKVYDVREMSTIEFEVPYANNQPWLPITKVWAGNNKFDTVYSREVNGTLFIRVLNSLRCPDTAADKIEALVFISAGDDFQLALPHGHTRVELITRALPPPVNAQSGFFPSTPVKREQAAMTTFGENVVSLRQLLKRQQTFGATGTTAYPWEVIPRSLSPRVQEPTIFQWVASLFRFQSGSVDITMWPAGSAPVPTVIKHYYHPTSPTSTLVDTNVPYVTQTPTLEPIFEAHLPWYEPVVMRPTDVGTPRVTYGYNSSFNETMNFGTNTLLSNTSMERVRSAGEDFNLSFQLGAPQTWVRP